MRPAWRLVPAQCAWTTVRPAVVASGKARRCSLRLHNIFVSGLREPDVRPSKNSGSRTMRAARVPSAPPARETVRESATKPRRGRGLFWHQPMLGFPREVSTRVLRDRVRLVPAGERAAQRQTARNRATARLAAPVPTHPCLRRSHMGCRDDGSRTPPAIDPRSSLIVSAVADRDATVWRLR